MADIGGSSTPEEPEPLQHAKKGDSYDVMLKVATLEHKIDKLHKEVLALRETIRGVTFSSSIRWVPKMEGGKGGTMTAAESEAQDWVKRD